MALVSALERLSAPGLIFFDGGRAPEAATPRWSIVLASPYATLQESAPGQFLQLPDQTPIQDPWAWLREHSAPLHDADAADPLPFIGGVAGVLGFELCWVLDPPRAARPTSQTPALWVGAYDAAACFDHERQRWHLVGDMSSEAYALLTHAMHDAVSTPLIALAPLAAPLPLTWAYDKPSPHQPYELQVQASIDGIFCGDLFEINFTERLAFDWPGAPLELYRRLRQGADGEFFGYVNASSWQLLSVSPEQFLRVEPDGLITTKPIKGSKSRSNDPVLDQAQAEALLNSAKDRAENVMIVDLMRNDLTQVCALGSVKVTSLCALESFAHIHHLVSTVEGRLCEAAQPIDALLSCFPAGSITGAPKLRAIEYAAALEHSARGLYTGSLFYASRHGRLDSSVLIRSVELVGARGRYGVGGAVVSDSSPQAELEEAWLKAKPLMSALGHEPQ